MEDLKPSYGSLVEFSRELVQVRGYTMLNTTLREGGSARMINVRYLFIYMPSLYNMFIGRPTFN